MEFLKQHLQSTTNRLVAACVLVHISIEALFAGQPSGLELYAYSDHKFHYWQLLSYMFLHGSWLHLGLNMLALWSFGRVLEQVWGGQRLLVFFVVCGVVAGLAHLAVGYFQLDQLTETLVAAGMTSSDLARVSQQGLDLSAQFSAVSSDQLSEFWLLNNGYAVGASGSVYGVLVAFAMLFPAFKIALIFLPIPIAARLFVPILLLIDLTAGFTGFAIFGQNIAHFAHLGGALAGFLMLALGAMPRSASK